MKKAASTIVYAAESAILGVLLASPIATQIVSDPVEAPPPRQRESVPAQDGDVTYDDCSLENERCS